MWWACREDQAIGESHLAPQASQNGRPLIRIQPLKDELAKAIAHDVYMANKTVCTAAVVGVAEDPVVCIACDVADASACVEPLGGEVELPLEVLVGRGAQSDLYPVPCAFAAGKSRTNLRSEVASLL